MNFRPDADGFFNYLAILYVELIAAEALVVLISALFPIFVVALALTAFANGLWMTVGGFLVTPTVLNVFWKYTFYQFDYQRYAFSALVRNQLVGSVYQCGQGCECMFVTSLAKSCLIDGGEAAEQLGYETKNALSYVRYRMTTTLILGAFNCYCHRHETSWLDCIKFAKEIIRAAILDCSFNAIFIIKILRLCECLCRGLHNS